MGQMIYESIANVMKKVKAIDKTRKNQQQNFMFRGIDDVMNELHQLFAEEGVFILPKVQCFDVSEKITEKIDPYTKQSKKSILYYTRATINFHFTAKDGSEVVTTNVGEAMDSGDKGMNKAMSIALKYALMQMLLIPTAEDNDPDGTTPPLTVPKTIRDYINGLNPNVDFELIEVLDKVDNAKTKEEVNAIWQANKGIEKASALREWALWKGKQLIN